MVHLEIENQASKTKRWNIRLENKGSGIAVVAVDPRDIDNRWYLVTFKADGTLSRESYIGNGSGFQLDRKGRIILSPEE